MNNILNVRGVEIGTGIPKICVPLMGESLQALLKEAVLAADSGAQLIEWRADFFEDIAQEQSIVSALKMLRATLCDMPILFTLRSEREGGRLSLTLKEYRRICTAAIEAGGADLIDIELSCGEGMVLDLLQQAQMAGLKTLLSAHMFEDTPSMEEMFNTLCHMHSLSADLPKIAVMPKDADDVLALLSAAGAYARHTSHPCIAISMGDVGAFSRVCAGHFGSAITFASLEKASAPGQIPAAKLADVLSLVYGEA